MIFHGSVVCVTVCRVPRVFFKEMLRGCIKTGGQILHINLTPFAKGCLEHSCSFLRIGHKLVLLVTSSSFYVGLYHAAGTRLCSPVMTVVWFGTLE